MKLRRILSLILALILPLSFLAACSDATSEDETAAAPSSDPNPAVTDTEETADPDARLDSGLPDADYGGYKFNIYIHNTITNDFEAEELTGEPINDAEYGRMVTVQDRGNCEITPLVVAADNRAGHTPLSNAVKAGTDDYDLACLSGYSSCNALVAGCLQNLYSVGNLDLTKPWWDHYCTEECTFKNAVFQMTGDLSIGDNKATFCYFFNKNMAEMYNFPNFYEMVDNNTWTIDNFREFAEAVDTNLDYNNNGNHINDKDDIYGVYIWDDMGGVRTAGDMVLRMQLAEKMKIDEAKEYVASKLGVSVAELCDVVTMSDVRRDMGLGLCHVEPCKEENNGMAAKFRIAEVLGIKINSVERFKERAGLK